MNYPRYYWYYCIHLEYWAYILENQTRRSTFICSWGKKSLRWKASTSPHIMSKTKVNEWKLCQKNFMYNQNTENDTQTKVWQKVYLRYRQDNLMLNKKYRKKFSKITKINRRKADILNSFNFSRVLLTLRWLKHLKCRLLKTRCLWFVPRYDSFSLDCFKLSYKIGHHICP